MPLSVPISDLPMPGQIQGIISTVGFWDIIDILLVAIILYKFYEMLQDTRAIALVKGLGVLMLLTVISNALQLHAIFWLLQKSVTLLVVALPIVFQPELRRALEHLGQGRFFGSSVVINDEEARRIVNEIDKAVFSMARNRIGALLVFERSMGLKDICDTGIRIDGLITADFLINVFIPNTPLHDGAAVIHGQRLLAAGCLLPLTDNRTLSTELGTRHRAAIGLSEQCDALVVVVSEETGTVSIAEDGHIRRHLDSEAIKMNLWPIFAPQSIKFKDMVASWRLRKK